MNRFVLGYKLKDKIRLSYKNETEYIYSINENAYNDGGTEIRFDQSNVNGSVWMVHINVERPYDDMFSMLVNTSPLTGYPCSVELKINHYCENVTDLSINKLHTDIEYMKAVAETVMKIFDLPEHRGKLK